MEARRTHQRHMAGVAVGMLLKPSRGVRDDIVRAGGKPKDHIKENVQALRATQKLNRIKKEDESKPEPAPFKLKEFSNVPSKISTRRPSASSSAAGSAGSSGTSTPFEATRPSSAEGPDAHKPKKNFIAINSAKVKNSPAGSKRTSPVQTLQVEPKHRIGQVPKYLVDRKLEWARKEEERIMALEQNKIPAGMALLPELDRIRTLNGLKERRAQLIDELSRFPMIVELPSLKARRAKLEREITEMDQGIDIFSRPKVFLPKDAVADLQLANR